MNNSAALIARDNITAPLSIPAQMETRVVDHASKRAERLAREHRLDIDRVIAAGLDALITKAYESSIGNTATYRNAFLCGYVGMPAGSDVLSLIDEARTALSPVVR